MSDDELAELVNTSQSDEAGLLRAMELLGDQAKLREEDDIAFATWVEKVEAIGTPEAQLAVKNAKRALKGESALEAEPTEVEPKEVASESIPSPKVASEEIRPMSALVEIGIAQNEVAPAEPKLEHDMIQDPEEVFDVEVDLSTGVAVSDFDAILNRHEIDDEVSFEPENFSELQPSAQSTMSAAAKVNPVSQLWPWLGLMSGVLPLGLGFLLGQLGLHGLQAFLALALGVLASGVVVAVGAVAGKRSGLPTLTLSRATFGVFGNLIPGIAVSIIKLVALAVFGLAALQLLDGHLFSIGFKRQLLVSTSSPYLVWALPVLASLIAAPALISIFGNRITYRAQQVLALIGLAAPLLVIGQSNVNISNLFTNQNESWWLVISAGLGIFAALGGLWSNAAADFSQDVSSTSSGFKVFGFAFLGFTLLPLVSGSLGILLAQNVKTSGLNLVSELAKSQWMTTVVCGLLTVSAIALLLSGISSLVSALNGIGLRVERRTLTVVVAVLVLAGSLALFVNKHSAWALIGDYLAVAGVILLGWTGSFVSEVLIRRIAYHEVSLQRSYGIYKSFNWVNLTGYLVSVAVGLGFVTSGGAGVTWVGYFIRVLPTASFWQQAQLGLAFSFLISALVPVAFGIGRIKRQEAEVLAIENRRNDLNNVPF